MSDLAAELPRLLPLAIEWAEACSRDILETGVALTPSELQQAQVINEYNDLLGLAPKRRRKSSPTSI
jgi:hypothetical protein